MGTNREHIGRCQAAGRRLCDPDVLYARRQVWGRSWIREHIFIVVTYKFTRRATLIGPATMLFRKITAELTLINSFGRAASVRCKELQSLISTICPTSNKGLTICQMSEFFPAFYRFSMR